jgi:hypothetical protein
LNSNKVTTRVYKVGRNNFIVIKIYQKAKAISPNGNAIAANQANVKISRRKRAN